jgi:hypothetical protein
MMVVNGEVRQLHPYEMETGNLPAVVRNTRPVDTGKTMGNGLQILG